MRNLVREENDRGLVVRSKAHLDGSRGGKGRGEVSFSFAKVDPQEGDDVVFFNLVHNDGMSFETILPERRRCINGSRFVFLSR